jgi:hypothetical protein
VRKKDSKGRDVLTVYLSAEEAQTLLSEAAAAAERGGEKGIKLTFHTGQKEAGQTGRKFDSTFFFVKEVQERSANGAPNGAATTSRKFVPRTPKTVA